MNQTKSKSLTAPLGKPSRRIDVTSVWRRVPIILRAVVSGFLLAAAGTIPWAILVSLNTKYFRAVPWAVVPAGLYLWMFWRFASGRWLGWGAEARRKLARAKFLSADVWGVALIAGVLGLASVVLLQRIMVRLVTLPQEEKIDISRFKLLTLLGWVVMGALVAGVAEETAFRGYIQKPIEQRHGPVIAILVTGSLFGLAHFTHPEVGLVLLPYYLSVATVYGVLAYLTNSIFPSMVLHSAGNMLAAVALFASGRSEWQASSASQHLIWATGADASFLISICAFVVIGLLALLAYIALAKVARRSSGTG